MRQPRFDPKRPLVAARDFSFMGTDYKAGDPFNPEGASQRLMERQYETRAVNMTEGEAGAADTNPVQMTGPAGGRYTITAPWLDEPEVVRGKKNAETRLAELREAGEPDSYKGFTLTKGDGGWYAITKDGVEGVDGADAPALKVQGEDNARQVANQLRAGETPADTALPEEWTPKTEETVDSEDGENADQKEDDVTKQKDPNDRAEELGNQPNATEIAADEQRAGTVGEGETPAGSGGDAEAAEDGEGSEGGDGTTGTVGP